MEMFEKYPKGFMGFPIQTVPETIEEVIATVEEMPTLNDDEAQKRHDNRIEAHSADGLMMAMETMEDIYGPEESPTPVLSGAMKDFLLRVLRRAQSEEGGLGGMVTVTPYADKEGSDLEIGFPEDMELPAQI